MIVGDSTKTDRAWLLRSINRCRHVYFAGPTHGDRTILQAIAEHFGHLFGPLRLFSSYLFLAGIANGLSVILTFLLLPRLWHLLPKDQGRAHAVNAEMSIGKPMGAGVIFVPIFAFVGLLVTPLQWPYLAVIGCMLVAMYVGYLDDKTRGGWSEYALGACDLVVSIVAATAVCRDVGIRRLVAVRQSRRCISIRGCSLPVDRFSSG